MDRTDKKPRMTCTHLR